MNQLCRNPQFSGIFISICHIWSSCWHDKCQTRLLLPVCRIRYVSYMMSKWWERRRQSSKQNGKVRILLNVFLAIHFRFHVLTLHLVLVLFDAVDKPPGFSPNLQVFLPWSPSFWSFGVERSARGPLFSEAHIKRTPYIILSERMAHFVWRLSCHFYCKTSLYSGNTN